MNQRAEIVLEGFVNDRTYRLSLPGASSFADAFMFLQQAADELKKMETVAVEQSKQAEASQEAAS